MDPDLFLVSGGLSAGAGLLGGLTGFFAANAKAHALDNAAVTAGRQGGVNAQEALQQGDAVAATAATRAAANGGGLTGSAMGVISNLSNQAMFNARTQVYRAQTEQQNDIYEAKVSRAQGISGLVGSLFGAAGSMVGGWAQDAQLKKQNDLLNTLRGVTGGMGDSGFSGAY